MSSKDYEKLTVVALRDELKSRDLSTDGKKAELVERLRNADKVAEEEILNTSVDSSAAINAEDLLNEEDVLGEVSLKPEEAKIDSENKSEETEEQESGGDKAVEIKNKEVNDLISQEAKLKRAQRFGLPVGTDSTPKDVKAKRAERFGITAPAPGTSDEAKAKRAARFGLSSSTTPKVTATAVDEETKAKLLKRAERFGLPVNKDGKTVAPSGDGVEKVTVDLDKLKARADRFGSSNTNVEDELKKKARLERFGLAAN